MSGTTTSTSVQPALVSTISRVDGPFSVASMPSAVPLDLVPRPLAGRGPFLVLAGAREAQACYHTFATEAEWRKQLLALLEEGADPDDQVAAAIRSSATIEQLLALQWEQRASLKNHAIFAVVEPLTSHGVPNIWLHPWTTNRTRSTPTGVQFTSGGCRK
jgi:hypothetical protein